MATTNKLTLKSLQKKGDNTIGLHKYATLGQICSEDDNKSASWYQEFFIEELEKLTIELEVPKLSRYGVTTNDITKIIKETGNKYNPAQLVQAELEEILHSRI